jgi:hypothetical protein
VLVHKRGRNSNMTDCFSNLKTLLNITKEDIKGFVSLYVDIWFMIYTRHVTAIGAGTAALFATGILWLQVIKNSLKYIKNPNFLMSSFDFKCHCENAKINIMMSLRK